MLNGRIRPLFATTNGLNDSIIQPIRWFDHIKQMKNDKIALRVYGGDVWKVTG